MLLIVPCVYVCVFLTECSLSGLKGSGKAPLALAGVGEGRLGRFALSGVLLLPSTHSTTEMDYGRRRRKKQQEKEQSEIEITEKLWGFQIKWIKAGHSYKA